MGAVTLTSSMFGFCAAAKATTKVLIAKIKIAFIIPVFIG
jgi:hypothetical protein